jgi:Protein of unknown function (DUF3379)
MNCLEFRRSALVNPHHPGHEALEHEASCPSCAHFYRELRMQEEALYEAMNVPVPDGLADRILLRQTRGWRERFFPRFAAPALAASLVLAVAVGVGLKFQSDALSPEMLAAGIVAHVEEERTALRADQRVPLARLVDAVSRSGGELGEAPGETSYANHCPLPGGGTGEHLVFNTPHGKLTLILMPGKRITHPVRLDKDRLTVSLMPAGEGSLALVSENREKIGEAESWARENLHWQGGGI